MKPSEMCMVLQVFSLFNLYLNSQPPISVTSRYSPFSRWLGTLQYKRIAPSTTPDEELEVDDELEETEELEEDEFEETKELEDDKDDDETLLGSDDELDITAKDDELLEDTGSGFGETFEATDRLDASVLKPLVWLVPAAPPPQAAVSNGAINTITAVVAFKRRCQFKLDCNCCELIKPSSINIEPSSFLALALLLA